MAQKPLEHRCLKVDSTDLRDSSPKHALESLVNIIIDKN
jgi:hypothetical protein